MRTLFLVVSLGALWDGYTSFYGIVEFYDLFMNYYNVARLVFAVVVALVILGFMIATHLIWNTAEDNTLINLLLKGAWVLCFVLDLYTSFVGNKFYVFDDMIESAADIFGLAIVSFLITMSSILLSQLISGKGMQKRYLY